MPLRLFDRLKVPLNGSTIMYSLFGVGWEDLKEAISREGFPQTVSPVWTIVESRIHSKGYPIRVLIKINYFCCLKCINKYTYCGVRTSLAV